MIRIKCTLDSLTEIIVMLVTNKYLKKQRITDEAFFMKLKETH